MLAFGLRSMGLNFQSMWRDEVDAVRFALRPLGDLLHTFVTPGENGPLYHLVLRFWLFAAGSDELGVRFLSVLAGVLAVPLLYRVARRLFPELQIIAEIAALLAASSPYLVWYSQEGKMYAWMVVLALLSMELLLAAAEKGGWLRWLGYVLTMCTAYYVHLTAVLMVPAQAWAFVVHTLGSPRPRWRPWLVSLAALVVPYLPLLLWQVPLLLAPGETGFRFVPATEMATSLFMTYSLGVLTDGTFWTLAPYLATSLAFVLFLIQGGPGHRSAVILLGWLLLPVIGLYAVSNVRPLFTARYLIFVLPSYLLLLACGVFAAGRHSRLAAAFLLAGLLAVNCVGLWRQATTPIKADLRAATRYVAAHLSHSDLVIFQIPHSRYSFDYYLQRPPQEEMTGTRPIAPTHGGYRVFLPYVVEPAAIPYRWAEGLYTNAGMTAAEVDQRMATIVSGSRAVWFVATEVEMWDKMGLVQGWLNDNAVVVDERHFVRVAVYRYEFP